MNFRNPMGVISFNEIIFSQEHSARFVVIRLVTRFGDVDVDEIRIKLDAIK
jgi:hypothetical protein